MAISTVLPSIVTSLIPNFQGSETGTSETGVPAPGKDQYVAMSDELGQIVTTPNTVKATLWRNSQPAACANAAGNPQAADQRPIHFEFDPNGTGAGWLFAALTAGLGTDPHALDLNNDGRLTSAEIFQYAHRNDLPFDSLAEKAPDEESSRYSYSYAVYGEAQKVLKAGDEKAAAELLEKAAVLCPSNALAWKALGLIHMKNAKTAKESATAASELGQAHRLGLADAEVLETLATYFVGEKDFATASQIGLQRSGLGFPGKDGKEDADQRAAYDVQVSGWAREAGDLAMAYDVLVPKKELRDNPALMTHVRADALLDLYKSPDPWRAAIEKKQADGDYQGALKLMDYARNYVHDGVVAVRYDDGDLDISDRPSSGKDQSRLSAEGKTEIVVVPLNSEVVLVRAEQDPVDYFNYMFANPGRADYFDHPDYTVNGWNAWLGDTRKELTAKRDAAIAATPDTEKALPQDVRTEIYGMILDNEGVKDETARKTEMDWMMANGAQIPDALIAKIDEFRKIAETKSGSAAVEAAEKMEASMAAAAEAGRAGHLAHLSKHADLSAVRAEVVFKITRGVQTGDAAMMSEGASGLDSMQLYVSASEPLKEEKLGSLMALIPPDALKYLEPTGHYGDMDEEFKKLPIVETIEKNRVSPPDGWNKVEVVLHELVNQAAEKTVVDFDPWGKETAYEGYKEKAVVSVAGLNHLNAYIDHYYGDGTIDSVLGNTEDLRRNEALKNDPAYQDRLDLEDALSGLKTYADILTVTDPSTIDASRLEDTRGYLIDEAKGLKSFNERERAKAEQQVKADRDAYDPWGNGRYDAVMAMTHDEREKEVGILESYRLEGDVQDLQNINDTLTQIDKDSDDMKNMGVQCGDPSVVSLQGLQAIAGRFMTLREEQIKASVQGELDTANKLDSATDPMAPYTTNEAARTLFNTKVLDPKSVTEESAAKRVELYRGLLNDIELALTYGDLDAQVKGYTRGEEEIRTANSTENDIGSALHWMAKKVGMKEGNGDYRDIDTTGPTDVLLRELNRVKDDLVKNAPNEGDSDDMRKTKEANRKKAQTDYVALSKARMHRYVRDDIKKASHFNIGANCVAIVGAALTGEMAAEGISAGVVGIWRGYKTLKNLSAVYEAGVTGFEAIRVAKGLAQMEKLGTAGTWGLRLLRGAANATVFTFIEPVYSRGMRVGFSQAWNENLDAISADPAAFAREAGWNWAMFGATDLVKVGITKGYDKVLKWSGAASFAKMEGGLETLARENLAGRGLAATDEAVAAESKSLLARDFTARKAAHAVPRWIADFSGEAVFFQAWGAGKQKVEGLITGDKKAASSAVSDNLGKAEAWEEGVENLLGLRFAGAAGKVGGDLIGKAAGYGRVGAAWAYEGALRALGKGRDLDLHRLRAEDRMKVVSGAISYLNDKLAEMDKTPDLAKDSYFWKNYADAQFRRDGLERYRDVQPAVAGFLGKGNGYGAKYAGRGVYRFSASEGHRLIRDLYRQDQRDAKSVHVVDVKPSGAIVIEVMSPDGQHQTVRLIPDGAMSKASIEWAIAQGKKPIGKGDAEPYKSADAEDGTAVARKAAFLQPDAPKSPAAKPAASQSIGEFQKSFKNEATMKVETTDKGVTLSFPDEASERAFMGKVLWRRAADVLFQSDTLVRLQLKDGNGNKDGEAQIKIEIKPELFPDYLPEAPVDAVAAGDKVTDPAELGGVNHGDAAAAVLRFLDPFLNQDTGPWAGVTVASIVDGTVTVKSEGQKSQLVEEMSRRARFRGIKFEAVEGEQGTYRASFKNDKAEFRFTLKIEIANGKEVAPAPDAQVTVPADGTNPATPGAKATSVVNQ